MKTNRMQKIPVYAQEKADGLSEQIVNNCTLSYFAPILLSDPIKVPEATLAQLIKDGVTLAKASDDNNFDLFYMKSILASSVWNLNEDYLEKKEIWLARHTPIHKQVNINHNDKEIVGTMIGSYIVDDKFNVVAEETPIDELPEKIHIVDSSVIYKYWRDDAFQEKVNAHIEDIKAGKKFVSMEALFSDFAYAYIDEVTGEQGIIERTKSSSFLTKHLRAYGGTGRYKNLRLARMPMNFVFSGKGIVDNPANPESVVLQESINFSTSSIFVGYKNIELILNGEKEMTELEKKIKELEAQLAELTAKIASKEALVSELQANVEIFKTQATEYAAKVKTFEAEKAESERFAKLKSFNVSDEDAKSLITTLAKLTSEDFDKYCEITFKKAEVKKTEVTASAATAALEQKTETKTEIVNPAPQLDLNAKVQATQAKVSKLIKNLIGG